MITRRRARPWHPALALALAGFALAGWPARAAAGIGDIWVADERGYLIQVNPVSGAMQRFTLTGTSGGPRDLAFLNADELFVTAGSGAYQVNLASAANGQISASAITTSIPNAGDMSAANGDLFVAGNCNTCTGRSQLYIASPPNYSAAVGTPFTDGPIIEVEEAPNGSGGTVWTYGPMGTGTSYAIGSDGVAKGAGTGGDPCLDMSSGPLGTPGHSGMSYSNDAKQLYIANGYARLVCGASNPQSLVNPGATAVDGSGNLLVIDAGANVYGSPAGTYPNVIDVVNPSTGQYTQLASSDPGNASDPLNYPAILSGIAVNHCPGCGGSGGGGAGGVGGSGGGGSSGGTISGGGSGGGVICGPNTPPGEVAVPGTPVAGCGGPPGSPIPGCSSLPGTPSATGTIPGQTDCNITIPSDQNGNEVDGSADVPSDNSTASGDLSPDNGIAANASRKHKRTSKLLGHILRRHLKHGKRLLRIPLNSNGRRQLKRHGRLHLHVTIRVVSPGYKPFARTVNVTLHRRVAGTHH